MVSKLDLDNNPPAEIPATDEVTPKTNETKNYTSIQFINRVMNYAPVTSMLESAKVYYSSAKESNYYVKKGCESVESNIDQTMKYVVNPVLSNEFVNNISEPVIHTVDGIACKQLDRLEKLQPQMSAISEDIKERVKDLPQKIEPIDQYLKTSIFATPINIAVGVSENLCDRFIPEKKTAVESAESTEDANELVQKRSPGPIIRSSILAKRLQQAFAKLSNLNLRDAETRKSFDYVVDLIQYAAKNLDTGVETTSKLVTDSLHKGVAYSKETNAKIKHNATSIKESTQEHVQHLTHEAMEALTKAIDVLSRQIPEPISASSHNLIERTKSFARLFETSNTEVYKSLATLSAMKLHETSKMITNALKTAETLPVNMIHIAANTLTGVLDNFLGPRDWTSIRLNLQPDSSGTDGNGTTIPTAMKSQ